jgi:hypothetical protein
MRSLTAATIAAACFAAPATPAMAGSHLWIFSEVFSNASGTIQFIEMVECCGAQNETLLQDKWIRSAVAHQEFTFPANLPCTNCTAHKHLLFGTATFAALPGAPTPDYIIPEGSLPFFSVGGDTLQYWFYTNATWTFGPVPTDGQSSLYRDGTTGCNSPTNFAGQTGTVTLACDPADLDGDNAVGVTDMLDLLAAWGTDPGGCPPDLDGDGSVAVTDFLQLLASWGPC